MAAAWKSRGTRVRHLGRTGRATTVLLAAGIGMLSPGAGVLPAWAQPTTVAPDDGGYYATAPPLDGFPVPADSGKPDETYEMSKGCVSSGLGEHIDIKSRPWGQEYLQIDKLQEIVRAATGSAGKGIKVAVIDTGVRQHPYFQDRVESGGDYVATPSKLPPGLEDCDGHGTEVAGIIAANPDKDKGIGFKGVAPDATILSIRQSSQNYSKKDQTSTPAASSSNVPTSTGESQKPTSGSEIPPTQKSTGSGSGQSDLGGTQPGQTNGGRQQSQPGTAGSLNTLSQAVVRAANAGASVINMSVDSCRLADGKISDPERALQAAMHYAVEVKNVVVVAAAGNITDTCKQNDQLNPQQPKTIVTPPWFSDDVLSVGAIDTSGGVASFSVNGPWVSVAAPGTEITSLDPAPNSTGLANLTIEGGNQPGQIQGTSFAAPYVAGVAALVRAKYPALNARDVMQRIKSTAQHPAAPGGRDNFVGYGVIDPMAALTSNVSNDAMPSIKPVQSIADLPPADGRDWTPIVVALAGAGGGLVALLITVFVMHTARRKQSTPKPPSARV
ncbi:S8 family serine peptidase [Amycolatopsis sp. H20-H5]|uniref:S8 family serine peptidase n=1 Tax=Amycolatopsis sp. H20-H5 TaxID=3046309 RepID=UPI002DB7CE44|nr:S8 family serine peptidase [Amycolatopsis sp. H20-H5]MEC3980217.1 S8 family serine peptidase [Amycolatopsis sp. H20-H5]